MHSSRGVDDEAVRVSSSSETARFIVVQFESLGPYANRSARSTQHARVRGYC